MVKLRLPTVCAVLIVAAILVAGCEQRSRLAILPGSTSGDLTFAISAWDSSERGHVHSIDVYRCVERAGNFPNDGIRVWAAEVANGKSPPLLGEFRYGTNVGALITYIGPEPLDPGCYIARVDARFPEEPRGAVLVFRVSADGKVKSDNDA